MVKQVRYRSNMGPEIMAVTAGLAIDPRAGAVEVDVGEDGDGKYVRLTQFNNIVEFRVCPLCKAKPLAKAGTCPQCGWQTERVW